MGSRFGRTMRTKWKRDDRRKVRCYIDCRLHDVPEREAKVADAGCRTDAVHGPVDAAFADGDYAPV